MLHISALANRNISQHLCYHRTYKRIRWRTIIRRRLAYVGPTRAIRFLIFSSVFREVECAEARAEISSRPSWRGTARRDRNAGGRRIGRSQDRFGKRDGGARGRRRAFRGGLGQRRRR